jgi:hypothetical protein
VTEAETLHAIQVDIGARPEVRIFRNNVGVARDPTSGQHLRFGLIAGASDLIGIVKPRGRFLALEVKSARGRLRPEQQAFLDMVNNMGGIGRVVRSVDEAIAAVDEASR